jgi:hypothetical protein
VAWVALWRAFHQTRKYSFLMIYPKLHDISPFFLLIFSLPEQRIFLYYLGFQVMAILCCAAKNSFRGTLPNTEISFLMISPKLLNICPVFLLVFSPIKTADLCRGSCFLATQQRIAIT